MNICKRRILQLGRHTYPLCRYQSNDVRVRFAPSPTGFLHLGGLRTALYNYLFARQHGGSLILRIEDTDQTRIVEGATENLINSLKWCGIDFDEGPLQGGQYGPYVQSQRREIYLEKVNELLDNGSCYHCFCTERRLKLAKREAAARGEVATYDNKCRHLTKDEVEEKISQNLPSVIRFKLENLSEPIEDLVMGKYVHNVSEVEGDPVILKSDNYPTYHFANVVDDHLMKITHVLRGSEWQISTPKHILLYRAFGWEPPQFAHLPLIGGEDGKKLSKRNDAAFVEYYKEAGYYSESLLNFITQVGGGFTENTDGKTVQEMIDLFSLEKVNKNMAQLHSDNLDHLERLYSLRFFESESSRSEVIAKMRNVVLKEYGDRLGNDVLSDEYLSRIFETFFKIRKEMKTMSEIVNKNHTYLWFEPSYEEATFNSKKLPGKDQLVQYIDALLEDLRKLPEDTVAEINMTSLIEEIAKEKNVPKRALFALTRIACTATMVGPSVTEIVQSLGTSSVIKRLENARAFLQQHNPDLLHSSQ